LGLLVAPVTPNTSAAKLKLPGLTRRVVPTAKAAPDCRRPTTSATATATQRRRKRALNSAVECIWTRTGGSSVCTVPIGQLDPQ